jgi:hypothetical protein
MIVNNNYLRELRKNLRGQRNKSNNLPENCLNKASLITDHKKEAGFGFGNDALVQEPGDLAGKADQQPNNEKVADSEK